jgi:hypothetical protein
LALGGGRGHRDGRAMEKRKSRERGCVMWLCVCVFFLLASALVVCITIVIRKGAPTHVIVRRASFGEKWTWL